MTIVYRTAGPWGAGKGSNLTPAEHDGNHYDHVLAIADLESNAVQPYQISSITQAGNVITFHLSDGLTTFTATLPAATPPVVVEVSAATLSPTLVQGQRYFLCSEPCLVTIPDEADVAYPVNTELHFDQDGDGAVRIVGVGSSILIEPPDGYLAETRGRGAVMTAKKIGSNRWRVFGLLADE